MAVADDDDYGYGAPKKQKVQIEKPSNPGTPHPAPNPSRPTPARSSTRSAFCLLPARGMLCSAAPLRPQLLPAAASSARRPLCPPVAARADWCLLVNVQP